MTLTRREALVGLAVVPAGIALPDRLFSRAARPGGIDEALFRALERRAEGRLGVAILDSDRGTRAGYRDDERFPMCSTFKLLAAAAVLARVDAGTERLDHQIAFTKADLLEYAPATSARVAEGHMTLEELCDASITVSDNTAANLILDTLGGPAGLTTYVRSLGDTVTRLDRTEPDLNEATPGDPRDTTSPAAMLATMQRLLAGAALKPESRERLIGWLVACKTGGARLRAGFPGTWRAGDKTGSGNRGTTNDVAVAWPPDRGPVLVAAYLTESRAPDTVCNSVLAGVGRLAAAL